MLIEALRHALIRCPQHMKRLGVLHGLIAVEARHRRCRRAWAGHLEQTKNAVMEAAESVPEGGTCVIVGSGLLLDVPLEGLRRRFRRIVLVDLFHMPGVRRQVAAFPEVELVACDVSGLFSRMETEFAAGRMPEAAAAIPEASSADLVVSLNCLSQLPLIPLAAAEQAGAGTPEQLAEFARAVVADHIRVLRSCRRALLVTDFRRDVMSRRGGQRIDWQDLLYGMPEPPLAERREWQWDIAPAPEESPRFHIRHQVVAGLVVPAENVR